MANNHEILFLIEKAARGDWRELDLAGNKLSSLPPEIAKLINLTILDLSNNQLTHLPREIATLTNLTGLNLGSNKIKNLQLEVLSLANLTSLSLYNNQLTTLPPEIMKLTKLKSLDLRHNQLTSLPPEFTELTNLTELNLGGNQLTSLPPEITKLTKLFRLNLWDNRLTSLPPEITKLTKLRWFKLSGNQLTISPKTLDKAEDVKAIFAALAGLESGERLNEVKMLEVGGGKVGKSSVVIPQANNPPTMQIFISYAREDVQYAKELYQRLERRGFCPWMDKVNLLAGQQWQPAIEKAMKSADFFLLLMSRHSIKKRGFVQREIRAALDLWQEKLAEDIYLIPVMLEAIPFPEVPNEVSKFQWVEFYEPDGWEQLVRAMEFQASRRGIGLHASSPPARTEGLHEHSLPLRRTSATTSRSRILRIVVASPGDVQPERDVLPSVIDEVNRVVSADRGLELVLSRWETDVHPGFHPEGPQGLIDSILNITDCELLIGIFWKRFGAPTAYGKTGTEHELSLAFESWKQNGTPQMFVYFNQGSYAPKSPGEVEQWGKVLEFKDKFPKEGLWWSYKGKPEFEKLVRNHLVNYIRNLD